MSEYAQSAPTPRGAPVVAGGVLAAIVLSSLINAAIAAVARAAGAPADFQPLEPSKYVFLTAVGVLFGAVGWAVIRRRSRAPRRLLDRLAPTVVLVSFVPDFFLFGDGGVVGVLALLTMHVAVGAVAVLAFHRVMPVGPTE